MGRIKSALEIALERTESVKGDKTSIDQFEAKQKGKRLANAFLEDPKKFPDDELKKLPKEQQQAVKQGMFDVFLSQITLPAVREDMARIEALGRGLQFILGDPRFAAFYKQFTAAAARYLEEIDQYGEAIRRQYAPKLRQKEEELSRRLGRQIQIDPFQDPEFAAFYNQNMNALRENYESLTAQVREQAEALYNG
jgi:uncharacterized protein YukE